MAPLLPTVRRGRPSQRLPVLPLLGAVVGVGWLLVRSKTLAWIACSASTRTG